MVIYDIITNTNIKLITTNTKTSINIKVITNTNKIFNNIKQFI